jgi:hypothetical protein
MEGETAWSLKVIEPSRNQGHGQSIGNGPVLVKKQSGLEKWPDFN